MERQLFGDENAVFDPLLSECYVEPYIVSNKPILVGRWGTGKSAIFFHQNSKLDEILNHEKEDDAPIWYFGEKSFNLASITNLSNKFGVDREGFQRSLEIIWWSEIIRKTSLVLAKTSSYYGNIKTEHWDNIKRYARSQNYIISAWNSLSDITAILTGNQIKTDAVGILQQQLGISFNKMIYNDIKKCLSDIRENKIQPIIIIEPLDTPYSPIENKNKIAAPLINGLLNVFIQHFLPSKDQLLRVRISLPWHRYHPDCLDQPERIIPFVGKIKWDRKSLLKFINSRIEWEFKNIKRNFVIKDGLDAFSTLFEKKVKNVNCDGKIREDTFDYYIRHTHYRPRELQRLVRQTVEKEATSSGKEIENVLMGKGGKKIGESTIRDAIKESLKDSYGIEFKGEVERKYPVTGKELFNIVYGISMPFTMDVLKKRFQQGKDHEEMRLSKLNEMINQMWEAGMIGIEIKPNSDSKVKELIEILPKESYRKYNVDNYILSRWYFFNYNYDDEPFKLLMRYTCDSEGEAKIILHPRTFEDLSPNISRECPIGI